MNKILMILGFCALANGSLLAEEPVVRIPVSGIWTIGVQASTGTGPGEVGSKNAVPPICSIRVTSNGLLRQEVITWNEGKTCELWRIAGEWVGQMPHTPGVMMVKTFKESSPFEPWLPFEEKDLVAFAKGIKPVETKWSGAPALLYHNPQPHPAASANREPLAIHPAGLWIDPKTRLPLALKQGEYYYLFLFSDQKPPALKPPTQFAKEAERFAQRNRTPVPQSRTTPTK